MASERGPIRVSTHDFPSQAIGKAIPYGVYDIASNEGFVNVGITAETAQLLLRDRAIPT